MSTRTPSLWIDENITVPKISFCNQHHNCLTCPLEKCVEDVILTSPKSIAGSKGGKAKRNYTPEQWDKLVTRLRQLSGKAGKMRWCKERHESEKTV
jgi:hypothetical protein